MSDADEQGPSERPLPERPTGRAALDSTAPRLTLPEDADETGVVATQEARVEAAPVLDAWNEDRARRSSFPPGQGASAWAMRVAQNATIASGAKAADDAGDALELVHRSSSSLAAIDLSAEMEERFSLDDFSGALRAAEFLLGRDPEDALARHYADASRLKLEKILFARVTRDGNVPLVAVREAEVRWLGLDNRAAWLLSRVDGTSTCDVLLEATSLDRLEGLRLFSQLLEVGAIRMR